MIVFPSFVTVSVPSDITLDGDSSIILRIPRKASPESVTAALTHYGKRIRRIDTLADALFDFDADRGVLPTELLSIIEAGLGVDRSRALLIRAGTQSIAALAEFAATYSFPTGSWELRESDSERMRRMLTALGGVRAKVRVAAGPSEDAAASDGDAVLAAADFYLHDPFLATPVEPFHGILGVLARGGKADLHVFQDERRGMNYFVSGNGLISDAARSLQTPLGCIGDGWDAISGHVSNSPGFDAVTFMALRSECAFCPHFRFCVGYFREYDQDRDCSSWRRAFDLVARETNRGAKDLEDGN